MSRDLVAVDLEHLMAFELLMHNQMLNLFIYFQK